MAITDLSQSVATLADAHRETMGLITRLRKLEGIGVDTTRAELVQLIHQSLKDTEQDLELLRIHIEDLPTGDQKTALTSKWHKLSEDTKIARVSYRKAQIEAKRSAEAARRQERELLLGKADGKRRLRGASQLSQDELVLNASTDITSSLKRTHALLSSELSRSQFASETLSQSTQALKELSTRYSTFDDMLLKSRRLITDLVRKNKSDAWYYEKAIYIMVITVVWLIIRRFLYGPLYLFVWLPLKLCWWTLSLFASMIGAGGSRDFDILPKSNNIPRNDGNDMVINQPKVEVQGLPKDLPQIPKSILPEPIIVSERGSEEASEEASEESSGEISKEVHGIPGVTAVTGAPAVPSTQRASDGIKMSEPDPVTDENSSYRESEPPPFKPFKENEPFLEQVGEALDKQREEARLKEHAPVLEMRHDEL